MLCPEHNLLLREGKISRAITPGISQDVHFYASTTNMNQSKLQFYQQNLTIKEY